MQFCRQRQMQTCPLSVFIFSGCGGHLVTAESPAHWFLRRAALKTVNEPRAEKVGLESSQHPRGHDSYPKPTSCCHPLVRTASSCLLELGVVDPGHNIDFFHMLAEPLWAYNLIF